MVTKRTATTATRSSARVATTTTGVASKDKRKRDEDDEEENDDQEEDDNDDGGPKKKVVLDKKKETAGSVAKKPALAKKGSGTKVPIRAGAHVNTVMPNPLVLPKAPDGCIKIMSWNGFKTYINAEDADVICLQEHKVNQPLLNLVDPKVYPYSWWGFEKDKKGYAGVAMFSKTVPISTTAGLPTHPDPSCTKGRVVTLEYPTCFLIGCYVPNAGQGLVRLKERMVWDVAMKDWLMQLKAKGKQIIWTGDLNVCHKPIDLRNPSTNTMSAGFTKEERAGFSEILEKIDLVDTFREIQGEGDDASGQYSYFSYRFQCRIKGIGWRLDYFVTDKEMYKDRVVESVIREECYGASDHVPVVLVVKGAL
ncbi:hypothetical protein BG011_005219 [Mortierella polycephala]|uniref:DNA-(apurinic or apyrimidinic site) endonuclease n=1 Tax=Mortierella polycephala TaxID=41804 RepID=A0A9P6PZC1_9FUNG|nr:hypothetical protein BG011_005219 [Mortierella polycephala]